MGCTLTKPVTNLYKLGTGKLKKGNKGYNQKSFRNLLQLRSNICREAAIVRFCRESCFRHTIELNLSVCLSVCVSVRTNEIIRSEKSKLKSGVHETRTHDISFPV